MRWWSIFEDISEKCAEEKNRMKSFELNCSAYDLWPAGETTSVVGVALEHWVACWPFK
jgi:hypothetical protein